jgi:hypothetical protein
MSIHTINKDERDKLTGQACELFKVRNPAFFPCPANSEKLVGFVESQIGMPIVDFPYVIDVSQWQAAYDYLLQNGFFYSRPVEEEVVDPAVVEEARKQQKVRDDYTARVEAEKIARAKNIPIAQLGAEVAQQNNQFREQRELNTLPVRATGLESRHVEQVTLGPKAQARVNVGLAHPELSPKSAEFTKLYAAELARLRS